MSHATHGVQTERSCVCGADTNGHMPAAPAACCDLTSRMGSHLLATSKLLVSHVGYQAGKPSSKAGGCFHKAATSADSREHPPVFWHNVQLRTDRLNKLDNYGRPPLRPHAGNMQTYVGPGAATVFKQRQPRVSTYTTKTDTTPPHVLSQCRKDKGGADQQP